MTEDYYPFIIIGVVIALVIALYAYSMPKKIDKRLDEAIKGAEALHDLLQKEYEVKNDRGFTYTIFASSLEEAASKAAHYDFIGSNVRVYAKEDGPNTTNFIYVRCLS